MKTAAALTLGLAMAGGCARVEVVPVQGGKPVDGVHFYRPAPHLLVTGPEKEGASTRVQVIQLPDRSQEYAVRVIPGWGTVNGTVALNEGWMLTSVGANMDSKGPETITAVSGLLSTVGGLSAMKSGAAAPEEVPPGLYRITFDKAGRVSGLEPVDLSGALR